MQPSALPGSSEHCYALGSQLRERPYFLCDSNLRIGIEQLQMFTYPDLSITHGAPQVANSERDVLTTPYAIVEVLSPATVWYDRTGKFLRYWRLQSFTEYLLIAGYAPQIELCSRQADGYWEWSRAEAWTRPSRFPRSNARLRWPVFTATSCLRRRSASP